MKYGTGFFILSACLLSIATSRKVRDNDHAEIAVSAAAAVVSGDYSAAAATAAASGDGSAATATAAASGDDSAATAATAASGDGSAATAAAATSDDDSTVTAAAAAASGDDSTATAAAASDDDSEAAATPAATSSEDADDENDDAESDDGTIKIDIDPKARVVCICQLISNPICGSDGVTYSNECVLNCVSNAHVADGRPAIRPMYRGDCFISSCKCPESWDPVCGANNQTYTNNCYFACNNAKLVERGLAPIIIAYRGVCKKVPCPDIIAPVCGTNDKTYRNICILKYNSRIEQAQGRPAIYLRGTGACLNERCNCPLIKKQLCASDGNTYYNQCALDCQNRKRKQLGLDPLTVKYPGECNNCICPWYLELLCASDGNTYTNNCFLLCENQKRRRAGLPDLFVRWRGSCTCGCTKEWQPVCASDQKTWANRCLLDCENKKRLLNGWPSLTVLYNGECSQCNCCHCPIDYTPVCGSDQKTYGNFCYLKCNSDCRVNSGLPPIWRIANRKCW